MRDSQYWQSISSSAKTGLPSSHRVSVLSSCPASQPGAAREMMQFEVAWPTWPRRDTGKMPCRFKIGLRGAPNSLGADVPRVIIFSLEGCGPGIPAGGMQF